MEQFLQNTQETMKLPTVTKIDQHLKVGTHQQ